MNEQYENQMSQYRKALAVRDYAEAEKWINMAIENAPCQEALPILAQYHREVAYKANRGRVANWLADWGVIAK